MDDLHAPTVASGPTSRPTANGTDSKRSLQELIAQKDNLEAELSALGSVLDSHGVNMNTSLMTFDGFPRADIDVAQIRTTRARIIRLKNDHKALMAKLEVAVQEQFASSKPSEDGPSLAHRLNTTTEPRPVPSAAPVVEPPFAKVNSVVPDSPAAQAGLQAGDKVTKFGWVNWSNHERLSKVAYIVQQNENHEILVKVLRESPASENYASVCSFVLCDSSTFLKFWLEDKCRETFLSFLPKSDLASLRLACHDFSVRAGPALFSDLSITFKTNIFTRPARLAALDRLGFYVKTLHFNLPHTADTFLPPLIEPDTGAELSFTYTPQVDEPSSPRRPKYGDIGTTEILTRQYPPSFHAATNVPAFVRAFSSLINLEHLEISCPGYDVRNRYRRSIVDYALISLRIAVEKNSLNSLESLTLSPIHPGGLMYLSPILGFGASPRSASRWSRIRHLTIQVDTLPVEGATCEPDQFKLLQTYIRNFQSNLESLNFRWIGHKGDLPVKRPSLASAPLTGEHPAYAQSTSKARPRGPRPLHFPKLKRIIVENISTPAADVAAFVEAHRRTIEELNLEDMELTSGTWDDALAPLIKRARNHRKLETADIPIMLSPNAESAPFPTPMERLEVADRDGGRKSLRMSKWLASKSKNSSARKVREGLIGCEQQLKKMLRGSAFPWRS
ncbi:hypothetical protein M409DRAFT_19875 [Zasmidium cellare ATCC 36951]|uniref:Probable 26S proteasome regulatory subunit p27 n=1 Tax=Zasmidium cellare ATCC 36951 TaxID=1080233 RepID=A0A6A6CWR6_ZASCE|nr:uncharacterized protein M409DRAFT_19875 [Zasmidium cellare ATCC 36951]KAF2170272.1 hypothetical protein M409DRAFT_19875 [Zasmidium cellare ATCC 36951]